ncbi:MAG: hypothetical protein LBL38_02560 [Lactobacillales bacterium]|jgi:hypothetical protein|nr:hypothetical protein [Lactobacillales bacterium]
MHHFSQNRNEVGNGRNEGIACYSGGRSPMEIHRFYHPDRGSHDFTTDRWSSIYSGWNDEGVAFHGSSTGHPVYRIWQPGRGDVILTTNSHEFNALRSRGWQDGGILCYTYILQ